MSQIAIGSPTTLFLTLLTLLCECFHSISVLTASSQATSDTSLHPLNHLTAIFFKTSTFFLLPIHHPPPCDIYVSCIYPFLLAFIYPCVFMPGMEMVTPSPTSPHVFAVKCSCHRWQFCSQLLQENSTHQQPPPPCQRPPKHLTQHDCLLNGISAIRFSPFSLENLEALLAITFLGSLQALLKL